jgi:hypothetical protein
MAASPPTLPEHVFDKSITGNKMIAASATRRNTIVRGGSSCSDTAAKKNDPPHSTERTPSSDQSRASIRWSLEVIAFALCEDDVYS